MINTIAINNVINLYEMDFIIKDSGNTILSIIYPLFKLLYYCTKQTQVKFWETGSVGDGSAHPRALSWINTLHELPKPIRWDAPTAAVAVTNCLFYTRHLIWTVLAALALGPHRYAGMRHV